MLTVLRRFALLALVALLPLVGCDDEPTQPLGPGDNGGGDTTTPVQRYMLVTLIKDLTGDLLTFIDVPTDTFIDTFTLPGSITTLDITPDKKRIFASSSGANATYVYDIDSARLEQTVTGWGRHYFDMSQNRAVRVGSNQIATLALTDLSTSLNTIIGNFGSSTVDTLNQILYAAEPFGLSTGEILRYDYIGDTLLPSMFIYNGTDTMTYIGDMLVIPEHDLLFAFAANNSVNLTVVADLSSGSISTSWNRHPPVGAFSRTDDGQSVYQSLEESAYGSPSYIWKYSASTGQLLDSITTEVSFNGGSSIVADSILIITPDNKWLYFSGTLSPTDGKLAKQNLTTGEVTFVPTGLDPQAPILMVMGPEF